MDGYRRGANAELEGHKFLTGWLIHWLHDWGRRRPKSILELMGRAKDVADLGGAEGAKDWVENQGKRKKKRRR